MNNQVTVTLALELALQLLQKSQEISAMVQEAMTAGRTTLTPEEWGMILQADDAARKALADAIAAKGG